ncbi:Acylphosphatase [Lipomyces chichibuensis]|uniref:Acylphosphatase n=1 Tax=Lipomyces chichibuensis TaxID=1546026 RepID=UPI003342EA38
MDSVRRIAFEVQGRVQGVGFRRFVERKALRIGDTTGWVLNAKNGAVKGEAQGAAHNLERLIEAMKSGPYLSRVDKVDYKFIDVICNETGFVIRSGRW